MNFSRLFDQAQRPWASAVLLCVFFWIVAAAGYSGGIQKHGMPDGARGGGIEVMLDASAKKPYVYRQLAPLVANGAERLLPPSFKDAVAAAAAPEKTFVRVTSVLKPEFRFRYICVYYLSFLSLFGSLFVLRKILHGYGLSEWICTVAPAMFVVAFPYVQTGGGYYYDQIEFFFMASAFLAAMRGNIVLLLGISLLATLNKESFFFFVPALFPLLYHRMGRNRALAASLGALLMTGLVNVALKLYFFNSAGVAAEFKLFRNILNYLNPLTYLQFENTYGIAAPAGLSIITLLVIAIVVLRGWRACAAEVRQHLLIATCLNLPLFLAFCATGELRNLSLLFVGFVVLGGHALQQWFAAAHRTPAATPGDTRLPL